jgi:hypothetical protein
MDVGDDKMKGLELSKQFFLEVGLPKIKEELPECLSFLAAGIGSGSQCHGNDDEYPVTTDGVPVSVYGLHVKQKNGLKRH